MPIIFAQFYIFAHNGFFHNIKFNINIKFNFSEFHMKDWRKFPNVILLQKKKKKVLRFHGPGTLTWKEVLHFVRHGSIWFIAETCAHLIQPILCWPPGKSVIFKLCANTLECAWPNPAEIPPFQQYARQNACLCRIYASNTAWIPHWKVSCTCRCTHIFVKSLLLYDHILMITIWPS